MKCSACGVPVQEGIGFCTSCGQSVSADNQPTPGSGSQETSAVDRESDALETVEAPSLQTTASTPGRYPASRAAGGTRPLKTLLASMGAVLVVGVGAIAWTAGATKVEPVAVAEVTEPAVSPLSSSPVASALPTASASSQPPTQVSIPLPDFQSSTKVRDGLLIDMGSAGLTVQVAGEKSARTYPSPVVAGELKVSGHIEDIAGSNEKPLLAMLLETRKPASGLNPEQYGTILRTYDSNSTVPVAESPVVGIEHSSFSDLEIHGSRDGSIALVNSSYSNPTVRFFAAGTLRESSTAAGRFVGQQGTTVFVAPKDDDCKIAAWSSATGTQLWARDYGSSESYTSCTVESAAAGVVVKVDGKEDYFVVIDPLTGQPRSPQLRGATAIHFDPAAALAVVDFDRSEPTVPALRVYNTSTWAAGLEVTAEKYKALGLQEYYLYGAKLYMTNTDEQPVLDAVTGAKLSGSWTLRPLERVSQGWTLVKDEKDGTYSLRANKDGVYPGPWW